MVYGGINTAGIQDCVKPGVIAFSYDDGPYIWTKDLLDLLDSYGAKATFFISKDNFLALLRHNTNVKQLAITLAREKLTTVPLDILNLSRYVS